MGGWPSCAPLPTGPGRWEGAAGLDLKLHGFSHKLPALARFIATSLAGLRVEPEAFARVKEALLRNVRVKRNHANAAGAGSSQATLTCSRRFLKPPCLPWFTLFKPGHTSPPLPGPMQYRNVNMNVGKHATYQRLLALKDRFWHADEVLPELEKLQPGDVQVGALGVVLGA